MYVGVRRKGDIYGIRWKSYTSSSVGRSTTFGFQSIPRKPFSVQYALKRSGK